jgi:hypothetical protein
MRAILQLVLTLIAVFSTAATVRAQNRLSATASHETLEIGSRLELFADDFLIERLEGTQLKLHEPHPAGVALRLDRPWEGSFSGYITVIKDGDRFRMYYRGSQRPAGQFRPTSACYAESAVGFRGPNRTGALQFSARAANSAVLAHAAPILAQLRAAAGRVPASGLGKVQSLAIRSQSGLIAFASGDGLRWLLTCPLLTQGHLIHKRRILVRS